MLTVPMDAGERVSGRMLSERQAYSNSGMSVRRIGIDAVHGHVHVSGFRKYKSQTKERRGSDPTVLPL